MEARFLRCALVLAIAILSAGAGRPYASVRSQHFIVSAPSQQLALKVRDSYRARTGIPTSTYIGTNGINPRADMAGLNLSVVPKVLVECGNMRNAGDAAFMSSTTGRQKVAEGLAGGLAAFLATEG